MADAGTLTEVSTASQARRLARDSDFLLLGFKAPWCPQCGPQRGVMERVQARFKGRVRFACLDLADDEGAAEAFSISGLPAFILFKHGEEAARLKGFTPAPKLSSSLDLLLRSAGTEDPAPRN